MDQDKKKKRFKLLKPGMKEKGHDNQAYKVRKDSGNNRTQLCASKLDSLDEMDS